MLTMLKYLGIIIFVALLSVPTSLQAAEEDTSAEKTVEEKQRDLFVEGFFFNGIEGTVVATDENEGGRHWIFTPKSDVEGPEGFLPAGQSLELLPSGTLQRVVADYKDKPMAIRLWARVTEFSKPVEKTRKTYTGYKSRNMPRQEATETANYLFPVYFLPLTDIAVENDENSETDLEADQGCQAQEQDSILPDEVRKALKPKKLVDLSRARKTVDVEGDMVLVNRTGTFVSLHDRYFFEVDGVGRNISDLRFELLPSKSLEKAISENRFGRSRWKVSGTVTKFNNDYLLLLQKIARVYSNGNFR